MSEVACINPKIEQLEAVLLNLPQRECRLTHRFAPGVYLREIFMPAGADGTFVIGQEHRTRHFNIVLKGRVRVLMGGRVTEIVAPRTFVSEAGVRKVLFVVEDTIWQTVHPTEETEIDTLEKELIVKSDSFKAHEIEDARRLLSSVTFDP